VLSLVSGSVAQLAEQGTHKPQVTGSSPVAATNTSRKPLKEQGISKQSPICTDTRLDQGIHCYLLDCSIRGLSDGTLNCYTSKLRSFHKFIGDSPTTEINSDDIRAYLGHLRERGCNSTTLQRHYRVLHGFWVWLISEEIDTTNPLDKIKCPRPAKKLIEALSEDQIKQVISQFDNSFTGKRNKALFLILVDCGLRLGEAVRITTSDIDLKQQLLQVNGKTGERLVRFGGTRMNILK